MLNQEDFRKCTITCFAYFSLFTILIEHVQARTVRKAQRQFSLGPHTRVKTIRPVLMQMSFTAAEKGIQEGISMPGIISELHTFTLNQVHVGCEDWHCVCAHRAGE